MRIETEVLLDFKDVLIRPKRSGKSSRSQVDVTRSFTFKHSGQTWTGVPIIGANMDTVGTLEMQAALSKHQMPVALHKHISERNLYHHFADPVSVYDCNTFEDAYQAGLIASRRPESQMSFYSLGINDADYDKFRELYQNVKERFQGLGYDSQCGPHYPNHPIRMVCIDVANGYTDAFVDFVREFRKSYPNITIMAGNVVTADMTEALILAGVDIVKVGIGPGSVCTTRKMTGVGYPQLSAIIECADAAHGLGGLVCADGGCTVPGDIAKAFGAGADFVMLGGMLAGHDQSGGTLTSEWVETDQIIRDNGVALGNLHVEHKFKEFYGMSSDTAMNKHSGGVASYRASEGKTVRVPYRGDVDATIQEILGGLRSMMTYIGASTLKEVSKRTTFVRVTQQLNEVFGRSQ